MKRFFLIPLLYIAFFTNSQSIAQKPVKEIPQSVRNQIVQVFMETYNDSTVKPRDRKKPALSEKKSLYEYSYDPSLGREFWGYLDIPKKILFGDMTGDGIDEMIITPEANYGGNSVEGQIFIFANEENQWHLIAHFERFDVFLMDQYIANGMLYGTIKDYDSNDAHCCPSLLTKIWYKYDTQKKELMEAGRKVLKKMK